MGTVVGSCSWERCRREPQLRARSLRDGYASVFLDVALVDGNSACVGASIGDVVLAEESSRKFVRSEL